MAFQAMSLLGLPAQGQSLASAIRIEIEQDARATHGL